MKKIYALAATFAAVASHRCVDLLASLGIVRAVDRDYTHVAVAPVAIAAVAMFVGLIGFAIADRDRWFADLVREVGATSFRRTFTIVLVFSCIALFGMESLEQLSSRGHLESGLTWLGTSLPAALAVFASIAAIVAAALRTGASGLLATVRRLRAIVAVSIATLPRSNVARVYMRGASGVPAPYALVVARVSGLRAPPL